MSATTNDRIGTLLLQLREDGTLFVDPEEHAELIRWTGAHELRVRFEVLPGGTQDDSLSVAVGETLTVGL